MVWFSPIAVLIWFTAAILTSASLAVNAFSQSNQQTNPINENHIPQTEPFARQLRFTVGQPGKCTCYKLRRSKTPTTECPRTEKDRAGVLPTGFKRANQSQI
jgi:hypothetical protein